MFGKPGWFRPKTFGWGLTPVCWQGWVYTAIWCSVMVGPFVLLISRHRWLEGFIWLAASLGGLLFDVRAILAEIKRNSLPPSGNVESPAAEKTSGEKQSSEKPSAADGIYFVGDKPGAQLTTRNFNLHVRR